MSDKFMNTPPDLSIIIISYNTQALTLACLKSVYEQTQGISYEVIVLDNNSPDNSAQAIASTFPQVHLIQSPINLGFAEGNNVCAKQATGRYLLLLNPDTVILNNAIKQLVDFAEEYPQAGIWGGVTLFADHSLNPTCCWKKMGVWNLFCCASGLAKLFVNNSFFNSEPYGGWKRDAIKQVDIVSGCFLLIKKTLWEKMDGFDSRFFMYGEEADLCLRVAKLGYTPMVTPAAEIIHYGGASESVVSAKLIKLLKAKVQLIRNHWGNAWQINSGLFLLILWPFTRYLAFKLLAVIPLTRSEKTIANYDVWQKVWQARAEWLQGYY
jgi:N-acetylglucosaminyl-diphospho-decaprenol L-rhamnosyltransferase